MVTGCQYPALLVRMLAEACSFWHPDQGIQDDRLRVVSLPLSYRKLWVIGQYCFYPNQQTIMEASELMGQTLGIGTTEHHCLPTSCGDTAVPTLGIGEGNKRTITRLK